MAWRAARGRRFDDDKPTICLYIERSKNANIVVYEARIDGEGAAAKLQTPDALDAYWLDRDPEYQAKARAKGKNDDREDLNMLERNFAYGVSCDHVAPDQPVVVQFVAIAKRRMTLELDDETKLPVVKCNLRPEGCPDPLVCIVERVWVQSTEPKHFWQMPSVEYIDIHGYVVATGEAVVERVKS